MIGVTFASPHFLSYPNTSRKQLINYDWCRTGHNKIIILEISMDDSFQLWQFSIVLLSGNES